MKIKVRELSSQVKLKDEQVAFYKKEVKQKKDDKENL